MPGKATRPDDGRRKSPGGYRGGGRPKLTDPSESKARKIHQVRAHDHEWPVIKKFIDCTRLDMDICQDMIGRLEKEIEVQKRELVKKTSKYRGPSVAEKTSMAKELQQQGKSQKDIATLLGLTQARVSQLLNS